MYLFTQPAFIDTNDATDLICCMKRCNRIYEKSHFDTGSMINGSQESILNWKENFFLQGIVVKVMYCFRERNL